ncbi:MAG: cytochrome C oxidase subunit IV family protein [Microthrixaceae bacterium]|nr:cytochrome C oxidase subunit IV family protein [Microthrixaceae bacterium]
MSTPSPDPAASGTETLPSSPFSEHDTLTAAEAATLEADPGLNRMVHHADMIYIKVGAVLAVLTAIEIALPELLDNGKIYGPLLIALMLIKFVLVAGFFMHLIYDDKMNTVVLGATMFCVALFIGLSLVDLGSRSVVDRVQHGEIVAGGTKQIVLNAAEAAHAQEGNHEDAGAHEGDAEGEAAAEGEHATEEDAGAH